MLDEIIAIYGISLEARRCVIVEDLLKATGHQEDCRIQMSDAEVITTGLVAARFYNGNQSLACEYLLQHNLIPKMLSQSRFCR